MTEKIKKTYTYLVPVIFSVVLAVLVLSPNPFGNSTDVIVDESYFLSSALSSIQNKTLPGFDFTPSGAVYGGLLTYLGTFAVAINLGVHWVSSGFSPEAVAMYAATHTGDMMQIIRWVNGIFFIVLVLSALFWVYKRSAIEDFKKRLFLLVVLLLGNSLFMGVIHTGKEWAMLICLELAAAFIVGAREYTGKSWKYYIHTLVLITALSASQNITGIFTGLWLFYALFLGHFKFRELVRATIRTLPVVLVLAVLQYSIFLRSLEIFERISGTLTDINGTSFKAASLFENLIKRFTWPIEITLKSQPVVLVGYVATFFYFLFNRTRLTPQDKKRAVVALVHPFFVLTLFYGLLGLGTLNRLALPMTAAFTASVFLALPSNLKAVWRGMWFLALMLAVLVGYHTTRLWWQPASEKEVSTYLMETYSGPEYAIVAHTSRFSLPPNSASLDFLSDKEKTFGRFGYLLGRREELESIDSFKSVFIRHLLDTDEYLSRLDAYKVVEVEYSCEPTCSVHGDTMCRIFNQEACAVSSYAHEVPIISDIIKSKRLGRPFAVWERKK